MEPTTTFNHDIIMIYDMCNRFIRELNKSQSSPVTGMTEHDVRRAMTYTSALTKLHEWIKSVPLLDLPETHPREFTLEPLPVVTNSESESVNMLIRLFEALRTEMINSQSARYASTMIVHDSDRFDAIVMKIEDFITEYVETSTPLDLPESSPAAGMVGDGNKGVTGPGV